MKQYDWVGGASLLMFVAISGCYGARGNHQEDADRSLVTAGAAGSGGRMAGSGGASSTGGASSSSGGYVTATGGASSGSGGYVTATGGTVGIGGSYSSGGYAEGGGIATAGTGSTYPDACAGAPVASTPLITSMDEASSVFTGGGYYIYADTYGGVTTPAAGSGTITPEVGGYSNSGLHFSGADFPSSSWGAGVGVWLSCVDASAFDGVSFWYKSDQALEISISIPSTQSVMYGGTCTATLCTNNKIGIPATAVWTQVNLSWAEFVGGTAPMDASGVTGVDIQIPAPSAAMGTWDFDVYVDELSWL